ncbi:hypothetical protein K435DRAFT_809277 [Dendrothele bispora CBS 962.96]|uniref:Uncharacterized protein n=1 Tax=Dendrothele bispora (strain CBS 962.96) TaxID=1314807 RepID=A0A4S8KZ67_DENBC|nr:hypothetical protein K435DRAFT_809277 [Dendrothele bispora CBS 962.96]
MLLRLLLTLTLVVLMVPVWMMVMSPSFSSSSDTTIQTATKTDLEDVVRARTRISRRRGGDRGGNSGHRCWVIELGHITRDVIVVMVVIMMMRGELLDSLTVILAHTTIDWAESCIGRIRGRRRRVIRVGVGIGRDGCSVQVVWTRLSSVAREKEEGSFVLALRSGSRSRKNVSSSKGYDSGRESLKKKKKDKEEEEEIGSRPRSPLRRRSSSSLSLSTCHYQFRYYYDYELIRYRENLRIDGFRYLVDDDDNYDHLATAPVPS